MIGEWVVGILVAVIWCLGVYRLSKWVDTWT